MDIQFVSGFLAQYYKAIAQQNDGNGLEFARLLELTDEYSDLMHEYSDETNALLREMRDNNQVSNDLFKFLSNPNSTEEDLEAASLTIREEYNEYYIKNLKGEIDRSKMQDTFMRAAELRRKIRRAMAEILPTLWKKYGMPEQQVSSIHIILTDMIKQLDSIILVGVS